MITADLRGKTMLVTGGASGIGLAAAELFAKCGAKVALNHLPDDPRGSVEVARLRASGLDVIAAPGDVGDPAVAGRMVADAVCALGRLDFLLNNAGTPGAETPFDPKNLSAMNESLWQRLLGVNLLGPFRCVEAAAPQLRAARGAIVNTASIAGLGGQASSMAYAAAKAALINLTRNLARALAPEVRVNAVAPGLVDSPWTKQWPAARKDASVANTMLKRMCAPEDVAEAMLYLCAGAAFVTGHTLVVDGGRSL